MTVAVVELKTAPLPTPKLQCRAPLRALGPLLNDNWPTGQGFEIVLTLNGASTR